MRRPWRQYVLCDACGHQFTRKEDEENGPTWVCPYCELDNAGRYHSAWDGREKKEVRHAVTA